MPTTPRLPTGTVTFLFTDIEGSTRLWEAHPDAMRDALAAHDAIFREIVPACNGVIFKTVGDAICAAFERPEDAVHAAVDAQCTLGAYAWPVAIGEIRVRMGIHTGVAQERDDDYFGRTVNRVARFMSIAHGGQILVSGVTEGLLRNLPPDGISLLDLGTHRLKDLAQAEATFQIVGKGLRLEFPALSSLDSHPNNLPSQISSFVGRERELHALHEALDAHRVVTIAGPGGIGKTRLALQLAAELIHEFKDGVWFVELALLDDAKLVAQTVAEALQIQEQANQPVSVTIQRWVAKKQLLLVLDNSEHLIEEAAAFTKALTQTCPSVRVLLTSRQPLHLSGEHLFRLSPLPLPSNDSVGTTSQSESLFIERALSAHPELTLGDNARTQIAHICCRLEGMPLAIELAAARVATLSLAELDRRLSDRLKVLVSRDKSREARHRTLRETIDWSYQLLSPDERQFACHLAVHNGSFTVEAAEAVASVSEDALDFLESMVSKSFVALHDRTTHRFLIYDTIREFLLAELDRTSDAEEARARHFAFYRGVLTPPSGQTDISSQAAWLDRVALEINNLRAAFEWSLKNHAQDAGPLATELARFCQLRGHIAEGYDIICRALSAVDPTSHDRAPLLRRAATLATMRDEYTDARRLNIEARDAYETIGDASGVAEATFNAGVVAQRVGDDASARSHYTSALEGFRAVGHIRGRALAIMNLSMMAFSHSHLESAEQLVAEAASLETSTDDVNLQSDIVTVRGHYALERRDYAAALACYERALAMKQQLRNRFDAADIKAMMAAAHVGLGLLEPAEKLAREATALGEELEFHAATINGLEVLTDVAWRKGNLEEAARQLSAARDLRRAHSYQYIFASTRTMLTEVVAALENAFGKSFDQEATVR